MEDSNNFNKLPEECVSTILSLTSPLDACRSSLVSSTFRSATESNIVWEKFLPSAYDLDVIFSGLVTPLKFSSAKELFLRLCDSVLIDSGKTSFKLQKSSGKKSYLLSARALSITWSNNPIYWFWLSIPESRFSEVAVLRTTDWLEIEGRIRTELLSPNTTYGAYLVMKMSERAYGFDSVTAEISVEVGDQLVCQGRAYLGDDKSQDHFQNDDMKMLTSRLMKGEGHFHQRIACEKENWWMEVELGEFFIDQGQDGDVIKMSLKEVKGFQLKGGLIVEGIEVIPKK